MILVFIPNKHFFIAIFLSRQWTHVHKMHLHTNIITNNIFIPHQFLGNFPRQFTVQTRPSWVNYCYPSPDTGAHCNGAHLLGIFSAIILSEWLHQEYALQGNSMNPTNRNIVHGRTNARLNQAPSAAYLYYSSSKRSINACRLFLARATMLHEISTAYKTHAAFDFIHITPQCHHSFTCVSSTQLNSSRLGSNSFAGQYLELW